jgi:hypothetical protein
MKGKAERTAGSLIEACYREPDRHEEGWEFARLKADATKSKGMGDDIVKAEVKISGDYGIGRLFVVLGRPRQRRGLARGLPRHMRFEKGRPGAGQRWDTRR